MSDNLSFAARTRRIKEVRISPAQAVWCSRSQFCILSFWSHILLKRSFFSLQESVSSLRHELSSNDLINNSNNGFDDDPELENRIVNLSNSFSENSMSGTYQQHQQRRKQVGEDDRGSDTDNGKIVEQVFKVFFIELLLRNILKSEILLASLAWPDAITAS